jgi:hypothetical protein
MALLRLVHRRRQQQIFIIIIPNVSVLFFSTLQQHLQQHLQPDVRGGTRLATRLLILGNQLQRDTKVRRSG